MGLGKVPAGEEVPASRSSSTMSSGGSGSKFVGVVRGAVGEGERNVKWEVLKIWEESGWWSRTKDGFGCKYGPRRLGGV